MLKINTIRDHYDRLAGHYEERWPDYNKVQIDWILQHWPQTNAAPSVLDLGCGTGLGLSAIRKKAPDAVMTGVDISPHMLKRARLRLPQARLIEGNIEDASLTGQLAPANIVLSVSVFHHLNNIDHHLRLLRDLTKPGGMIFLSGFAREGLLMNIADRYFRWRQDVHHKALSVDEMQSRLAAMVPFKIKHYDILRPNSFWRIQIFAVERGLDNV